MKKSFLNTSLFDKIGVSAATICFVHCLIIPFLIPFIGVMGVGYLFDESIEFAFFIITFVVAFFSLSVGFFKHHRKWYPYFLLFLGVSTFVFKFFFSDCQHCAHSTFEHFAYAFLISGFIIASHLINMRLCKQCKSCKKDNSK